MSSVPHSPRLLVRPWAPSLLYFSFSSFLFLPRVLLHPRFFRGCLSDSLPLLPLPSPSCRSLSSPEKDGVGLRIILYSSCPFASRELFVIFQLLLSLFPAFALRQSTYVLLPARKKKFNYLHCRIIPSCLVSAIHKKIPFPAPPIQIFFFQLRSLRPSVPPLWFLRLQANGRSPASTSGSLPLFSPQLCTTPTFSRLARSTPGRTPPLETPGHLYLYMAILAVAPPRAISALLSP